MGTNDLVTKLKLFLPAEERETVEPVRDEEAPTPPAAYRILVAGDNASLAKLLATGLSAESAQVDVVYDRDTANDQLQTTLYDLVVLDLNPYEAGGLPVLQRLRAQQPDVRVLVLADKTSTDELVAMLDQGADGYLVKPFSLIELVARVRALRRRTSSLAKAAAKPTGLILKRDELRVERDGRQIDLTPREFALLEYLMQNAGKPLSRAMLMQEVWSMPLETNTNIVDVYIKYLRDKLDGEGEEKLIRTVRGMGYLLQTG